MFPNYQQVLSALVDAGTDSGSIQVNPPSTGWPTGTGYQINLAADAQRLDALLAQSEDFTFKDGASSVSASGSAASGASGASATVSRTALSIGSSPTPYVDVSRFITQFS